MALVVKDPPAYEGDTRDIVGKIPWRRRTWQPTPVFLRELHGKRSLRGATVLGASRSQMQLEHKNTQTSVVT